MCVGSTPPQPRIGRDQVLPAIAAKTPTTSRTLAEKAICGSVALAPTTQLLSVDAPKASSMLTLSSESPQGGGRVIDDELTAQQRPHYLIRL